MKPHVVCHMLSSVDGRILSSRWRPDGDRGGELFERLHEKLEGDAWLVGRTTGQEFARRDGGYPPLAGAAPERRDHILARDAEAYGIVLDRRGTIAWGRSDIGGDPIVVLTTRRATDAHLAGLRDDGVSYLLAGDEDIDLAAALERLNGEFGIRRLLLEGGGGANGAFLRAGLVDELSLVVCPVVDGAKGSPSVFDSAEPIGGPSAPLAAMTLEGCETIDGGAVWLRYAFRNEA